jgi:hypothetical protein
MRRLVGLLTGLVLTIALAPAAAAAQPGIFRDTRVYEGYDSSWSDACGVKVMRSEVTKFSIMDMGDAGYDGHVATRQTLTGPGGSVALVGAFSFGSDTPTESYLDETTGFYTEVYRETYRGAVTVYIEGTGQVTKQAGWLSSTVTIAFPEESEPIITVEDLVVHGLQVGDTWGPDKAAVCSSIA